MTIFFLPTRQPSWRDFSMQLWDGCKWWFEIYWLVISSDLHIALSWWGFNTLHWCLFIQRALVEMLFWHSQVLVLFYIQWSWGTERIQRGVLNKMSSHLNTLKLCFILSKLWVGLSLFYCSHMGRLWKQRQITSVPIHSFYCLPDDKYSCSLKNVLDLKYIFFFFSFLSLWYLITLFLSNISSQFCEAVWGTIYAEDQY